MYSCRDLTMYGIVRDMTSLSHMVCLSMAALMGMCIILILLQMLIYLLPLTCAQPRLNSTATPHFYISLVHDATNMRTCSNMNMNKNTNNNMNENVTRGFCTLLADTRPFPLNCHFACSIGWTPG